MRRRWRLLALALVASPAFGGEAAKDATPVTPIAGPPTPFSDMMLDVQRIQARMAQGDKAAYGEQRQRLRAVGAAIAAAAPEAFKVRAERDAAIGYLLSGGQPSDVAKIVERGDFPPPERDLLRGAAGYTGGRQSEAEKLLAYDPNAQSLRLGSQLAYAQSVLLAPRDGRKSLALLDLARLLSPGTLIEEAALRREILLVGDLRDPERVAFLARQYVERFGASLYASDFVHSLAAVAIRFDLCTTLADLAKFTALMQLAPPEQARAFLLTVARASLFSARFEIAAKAAVAARATAAAGSPDEARAELYAVLPRFPGMAADAAKAALTDIAANRLSAPDRALLSAATDALQRLGASRPPSDYADMWRETATAEARSPDLAPSDDPAAVTLRRGAAALDAAEALSGEGGAR